MSLSVIVALIGEVSALVAVIVPVLASIRKIKDGMKCQLRSEMLSIYYRHVDNKEIRQYEFENFVELYEAYIALKGNSFIKKIYDEVTKWRVIS